jgi:hypothetical protein
MSTTTIPMRRITLYKNNLGYFERTITSTKTPAILLVADKHKKLVIDTLCTTASSVIFDTEVHDKHVIENTIERFFAFTDFPSTTSFATFLKTCIGAEVTLSIKDVNKEQSGKLVMFDEIRTLLNPSSIKTTKQYVMQVLSNDGYIRHFGRKLIVKFMYRSVQNFLSIVSSINGIKFVDTYLQEQLEKVLRKTLESQKPPINTSSEYVRLLFNTDNLVPMSAITTATNTAEQSPMLKVSYCYATKEWRCLYRCEIDSSSLVIDSSKVDVTLFGSINNPTEEDWPQVELVLVANELEILNNNKTTTTTTTTVVTTATTQKEANDTSRGSPSSGMQIFIKTLTGKTITIDVCIHTCSLAVIYHRVPI